MLTTHPEDASESLSLMSTACSPVTCPVQRLTSEETFACRNCRATFKSQADLDMHDCLLHDQCPVGTVGSPITFRCMTCGEAFVRRGELLAHLRERDHRPPANPDGTPPGGPRRSRPRRSR
jgi:hypothetical protein